MCGKLEVPRLRGYIVKYSLDMGTGLIKPILRRTAYVQIPGGELFPLTSMDTILFKLMDLNMKNSGCANDNHTSLCIPRVGCIVSFVVRDVTPSQRNIHTCNLAAAKLVLEDKKSHLFSQTLSRPDFQEWMVEMKRLNSMILNSHKEFREDRDLNFTVNTVDGIPMDL